MKSANCLLRQKHPTVPVGAHLGATHPPVPVGAAMAAVETPPRTSWKPTSKSKKSSR